MKLFEYAIIYNPRQEGESAKLISGITTVLATNQQNATILASRQIPEEYLSKLDQVEIAVRPF